MDFLKRSIQEALALEFTRRKIPFEQETKLIISFKGIPMKTAYRADFI